ncbi:MAG: YfhO family protein [Bacteroidaceae bacterium]|nr:YfhO family protein [Bacteroidaceae bacterium]
MKKIIPDIIAILTFVVISFVYFYPADFEGRILFQHDTTAGAAAGQEAKEYFERTGERTRWTNSMFGGMPTYQISPSYGSTDTLGQVQKVYQLWLPEYVRLAFIMLLGFYILLRAFGLSVWLSALGGIIWGFSSYFFILIAAGHIWKFVTLAFIPPTIAGMVLAYRGKIWQGGIVFALFVALQILSNHVQMSYYFLFVMLFMVIAYGVEAYRKQTMPQFLKASAILAVAGLMGVAINLSNLYHTYTYSLETMRGKSELTQHPGAGSSATGGLEKEYITQWSYGVDETLTLLVPNLKGGATVAINLNGTAMTKANPKYSSLYGALPQYFGDQPGTAGPVYVGAFVLFLFLLGCFIVKGPMKWALLGATIFSIVLSWGKNFMPVTDFFIDFVPMYNKFRAVSSILVIAEFTIPLLAILALKEVFARKDNGLMVNGHSLEQREQSDARISYAESRQNKTESMVNGQWLIPFLLTAGLSLLIYLSPGSFTEFIPAQEAQMLQNAVNQGGIPANELAGIMANLSEMRAAMVSADALRSFIIVIVGVVILFLFLRGKLRKDLTIGAIALLCLFDMWQINKRYLYDDLFVEPDIRTTTFAQTEADKYILEDTDLDYRVLNFALNPFNENTTSYWHKNVGGYHAAKLRRYNELIEIRLKPEMQAAYQAIAEAGGDLEQVDPTKFSALNMMNARYFILPTKEGEVPIENPYALGNAWFVEEVNYVANADEELDMLADIYPGNTAVVDNRFKPTLKNVTSLEVADDATIELTNYEPNNLTYQTNNPSEGVAVFSEVYYKDGWHATIDGEPVELARANYVLRTLYVPAGNHTIQMTFDPQSIHVTEAIAYIAMVLLLVGIITVIVIQYRKRKQP